MADDSTASISLYGTPSYALKIKEKDGNTFYWDITSFRPNILDYISENKSNRHIKATIKWEIEDLCMNTRMLSQELFGTSKSDLHELKIPRSIKINGNIYYNIR